MASNAEADWDAVFLDTPGEDPDDVSRGAEIDPSSFPDADPTTVNADIDPSSFLEAEPTTATEDTELATLAVASTPPRRRGRPVGTCGSGILREHQKRAQEALQEEAATKRPQPGSIEFARACKKNRKSKPASANGLEIELAEASAGCRSIMDSTSILWSILTGLKNPLHDSLVAAAQFSMRHQTSEVREASETAVLLNLKSEAVMSDKALQAAMKAQGYSGKVRVDRLREYAASACVLGAGAAWTASLHCIRELVTQGKLRGICFLEKCRYDETPLHVRIEGQPSAHSKSASMESCQHGKVLQVEFTVHMVLEETASGRRLLFAGRQPTALQTMNSTTAECILKALQNVRATIPGLAEASAVFEHYMRLAAPELTTTTVYSK